MRSAARLIPTDSTCSILSKLSNSGFAHIAPNYYLGHINQQHNIEILQGSYQNLKLDPSPGNRFRAYTRYNWDTTQNKFVKDDDNNYFQTIEYNETDGGKIRKFDFISDNFLSNPLIKSLLEKNAALAKQSEIVKFDKDLKVGFHQIRYHAEMQKAAYSSPVWLHRDNEPLVFVHLLNLTSNLLGGDNVLAKDVKTINDIIRLIYPLETIVLTKKYFHAVTPMGSANQTPAFRDILLVTFQNKLPQSELQEKSKRQPRPSSAGFFTAKPGAETTAKNEPCVVANDVPAIHWLP